MNIKNMKLNNSQKLLNGKLNRIMPYVLAVMIGVFALPSAVAGKPIIPFSAKNMRKYQLFKVTTHNRFGTSSEDRFFTRTPSDVYEYHTNIINNRGIPEEIMIYVPLSKLSEDEISRLQANNYDPHFLDNSQFFLEYSGGRADRITIEEEDRTQPWYNANDEFGSDYGQIVTYDDCDNGYVLGPESEQNSITHNATALYGGAIGGISVHFFRKRLKRNK